ncbi:helix-turn-helix domain-containing protein [uncultured Erythrobacter sp.]|uniref:winged helix-turn-helix transcriptional regulator n=1 Tax=uncultured Erythrobacter sp. TaxID=263913 RepID=UPI002610FF73|nr:helix-turn-helix domain-containing protein [uncultured Erythrobacter sp.]
MGDSWSFLILRDAFFGVRRFDGLLKTTGASPNILSARLKKLVSFGILEKRAYHQKPLRFEYRLTEKGRDLYPAIVLLMKWGDRWAGANGVDDANSAAKPPIALIHRTCGLAIDPILECDKCGEPITVQDMEWKAIGD